jgi:hypothetical protein
MTGLSPGEIQERNISRVSGAMDPESSQYRGKMSELAHFVRPRMCLTSRRFLSHDGTRKKRTAFSNCRAAHLRCENKIVP